MSESEGRILAGLRRAVAGLALVVGASLPAQQTAPLLMLRLDDVGMNDAVNGAIARIAATGMPFSASVLFAAPRHREAVQLLKRYPTISVGVHLALNSEWKGYRWGPVLGAAAVPSLVDSTGNFVHSTAEFLAKRYDLGEVERELTAQVERAMQSGITIDYVDYHMGTAVATPELRAVVERVAARFKLGVSRYFNEAVIDLFAVSAEQKAQALATRVRAVATDRPNLVVIHVAEATPEMRSLVDMNNARMNTATGEPLTYLHRVAEMEMLLSPAFQQLVKETGVRLSTYRELIAARGLAAMKRPGG
jgi:predicted glycoside hydrolase/deacetylase ChbG (UPF0249 family)